MELDKVFHGDCFDMFRSIPDNSVDLVITDPPYNIANDYSLTLNQGKLVTTKEAWGKWDSYSRYDYELMMLKVISECYRVLKWGGSLYMFSANKDNSFFINKAIEKGFTYRNQLAILKKKPQPQYRKNNWRNAFELCMYLTKGRPKTFNFLSQKELVNVYPYVIGRKFSRHPTEKPLGFIKKLVRVSSNVGDVVLDPFMGSGTTAVACKALGRHFVGAEANSDYMAMIERRLSWFSRRQFEAEGLAKCA